MEEIRLCMEDSRPRVFWFENMENGEEIGEPFFYGDITTEIKRAKGFGMKILIDSEVREEIKDYL